MTRKTVFLLLSLGLLACAITFEVTLAEAQPVIDLTKGGASAPALDPSPHKDLVESSGKGMALLFWAFAAATVGGALFVITRKNLIAAVMGMVGSFLGISAIYMMLYASFLSVIQMLVYAGAIMVLFVFVIMILNRPEDDPIGKGGRVGKALAGVGLAYLFVRLASLLLSVKPADPEAAAGAPAAVQLNGSLYEWGSTKAVGKELFTGYVFPFEAISILLLVAVVGAIAVARPLRDDAQEGA